MLAEHTITVRVRYCETDSMGFLHHSQFLNYFEQGRTELFRSQGGNYRAIEEGGLFLVVVRLQCNYHAPARYDDLLTLVTKVERISAVKIEHSYHFVLRRETFGFRHQYARLRRSRRSGFTVTRSHYRRLNSSRISAGVLFPSSKN